MVAHTNRFGGRTAVVRNLIPGKPERRWDVYSYDRATRKLSLLAHTRAGGYPDWYTYDARISGDGRTVAFATQGDDIVPGDSPTTFDLFITDVSAETVVSPTLGRSGDKAIVLENLSTDGRLIQFRGDADGFAAGDANGNPDGFTFSVRE